MSIKRPTDFIYVLWSFCPYGSYIMFFFRMAPLGRIIFERPPNHTRTRFLPCAGVGDVAVLLNFPSIRPEVTLQAHRHCNVLRWYDVSHSNHGPFVLYDNVDSCPKMVRWCFQLLHSISPI